MRRFGTVAAVLCLLGVYYVLATTAARTRTNTFDEIVHITAGYNAWVLHDHRFDPGNGDFAKRWATLPLLHSRPNHPSLDSDAWRQALYFDFSRDFMYRAGNDPDELLRQTRGMIALLGVALCGLAFVWAHSVFGRAAAFVALTLCVFCPNLLAHGATVSSDLGLTLMLLGSTFFIWRVLHALTWANLAGSVLFFSLLAVSKMTAVLILPITGLLIVARFFNPAPWRWSLRGNQDISSRTKQMSALAVLVVVHALAAWLTIWTVFGFKYEARGDLSDSSLVLPARPAGGEVKGVLRDVLHFSRSSRILPEGYVDVLEQVLSISDRRPSFLNGHWKAGGQALFYPFALAIKTPPAAFVLLGLSIAGFLQWRRRTPGGNSGAAVAPTLDLRRAAYESLPLVTVLVVTLGVAINQALNIGYRHILPVQPVLYILAGGAAVWLASGRRWAQLLVGALVAWFAAESLVIRPYYLAYTSPVAGGPDRGYQRLADSSLDWGQDLPGLKAWLDRHAGADRDRIFLSYFGTALPEHYGIESNRLPGFPEWRALRVFPFEEGLYAISATHFQQLYVATFGPWNRVYEQAYQETLARLGLNETNTRNRDELAEALQRHPPEVWQAAYADYEKLRFGRLCAWLRSTKRKPDAQVGHSILLWKLTAADLRDALFGAPRELYELPAGAVPEGVGARTKR